MSTPEPQRGWKSRAAQPSTLSGIEPRHGTRSRRIGTYQEDGREPSLELQVI
jgi:hypothetical protein